jgi:transposase
MSRVRVRRPVGRGRPRTRPGRWAGAKGSSDARIRRWWRRRRIGAVIPRRQDQRARRRPGRPPAFDREADRRRNGVERGVGWLKECRRVAPRHDKLAVNCEAMVKLAMIQRYRRLLVPSDRA